MASSPITLAFIDARPQAAVRALETMSPEMAAAFLETIPTRFCTRLVSRADAWSSSAILRQMAASHAAAILRELPHRQAVAILRLTPEHLREPMLKETSRGLRRALEVSLSFAEDTVGAHMSPQVLSAAPDETVAQVRSQIRRAPTELEADLVVVVERDKRIVGAVPAPRLLRAAERTTLRELATSVPTLSARARLASILRLDAWNDFTSLPVINSDKELVGLISRGAAHEFAGRRVTPTDSPSIPLEIMTAFMTSAVELAKLLTEPVGAEPASGEEVGP